MVDTVLVMLLLMTMVMGVLQLGLAIHTRNTLAAAAAEGARYGANADASGDGAAERARRVIDDALPARYAADVTSATTMIDGLAVVVVEVRAPLPIVGPWGPADGLTVRGHALLEGAS